MKKVLSTFLLGAFGVLVLAAPTMAQGQTNNWDPDAVKGFGQQGAVGVTSPTGTDDLQGSQLLDSITTAINWILGLLATIALVVCLYGGFLMVTAAGDDGKYKKGMGILKQAAIGLLIIGVSWLIISLIFWLIGTFTGGGGA